MRHDDASDQRTALNHADPTAAGAASEDAQLATEFGPEHEALLALSEAWSATTPSSQGLANFARQLPSQERTPRPISPSETLPERLHRRLGREAEDHPPTMQRMGAGRLLAGLVAAAVIVGLLAATLLRFAPGRTAQRQQTPIPAVSSATPQTARTAEEPSREPPMGAWMTVAQAQLIPAPSDGRVVYQTNGAVARVSRDGGATWRTLTIPAFSQKLVTSVNVTLRVSAADANIILLSMTLTVSSYSPSDCPSGSRVPSPGNLPAIHGGILASGAPYCIANFASHDGGDTWASMTMPTDLNYPPSALDPALVWQLGRTLYGLNSVVAGPLLYGSSLLVSHDLGVTWAYTDSKSPETSAILCSFLPSTSDGALYAVTAAHSCFDATASAYAVWRSVDGGENWRQVSSLDANYLYLVAATPAPSGRGVWLYVQKLDNMAASKSTMLVSVDNGATWSQAPQLAQPSDNLTLQPITGALADGSTVVAASKQQSASPSSPPVKTSFYAWRPGDVAWRPLTTPLTANNSFHADGSKPIALSQGGPNALNTLWVIEAGANVFPQTYTTHRYTIS